VRVTTLVRALLRGSHAERGFTMFTVIGVMFALMVLTVGFTAQTGGPPGDPTFESARGDQGGARYDQDQKRALAAAEAGVNDYLARLNEDSNYWTKCDEPAPEAVNQPWDGTPPDPRVRMTVPGSDAQYTIELLPAKDLTGQRYPACDPAQPSRTMINTRDGTFQIRSTGFARRAKRSLIATFRKKGFLDFIYVTDNESSNPVAYKVRTGGYATTPDVQAWASNTTTGCMRYYRNGRGSASWSGTVSEPGNTRSMSFGCWEINFLDADAVRGPFHTNDQMLICGRPDFGRSSADKIEVSQNPGWRPNTGCSGNNPNFIGTYAPGSAVMALPPSNSKLKSLVDPGYTFTGRTTIRLSAGGVTVNGQLKAYPPNGIIYVENDPAGPCSFYDPTRTEVVEPACGDALVEGTYGADLTIAAEKDVVVTDDTLKAGDVMLGLIANNFVRVGHPVSSRAPRWDGNSYDWNCTNNGPFPNQIDAAILALNQSFIVDNYYCGASLGTLTVNGAIAQKVRGFVTAGGGGYIKNYVYDDRLKFRQPPHFLDPVRSAWRVLRQKEQTPAR
jgi:hypothetical protein